jgi:3-dehydroquinate synthase
MRELAHLTPGPIALITDRNVERLYGATVRRSLKAAGFAPGLSLVLPAGERTKTLAAANVLYARLAEAGLGRGRPIVALGGGVIGDLAGFVAATWLRGVPLVHVPTTVLAQLDSSIGSKVGVDLPQGKNLVGAFHQPRLVYADPRTLETLPMRQVRAGLAEAVKVGFALDRALVAHLERHAEVLAVGGPKARAALSVAIERSMRAKVRVVAADERDGGVRQLLNYGHTFGHALELVGGYKRWLHGEAVALGMVAAAHAAVQSGMLRSAVRDRQEALLVALGLPVRLRRVSARNVFDAMRLDKKGTGSEPRFVLTTGVGVARFGQPLTRAQVLAALQDTGADP